MDQPVEFLGIVFRSSQHMVWGVGTVLVTLVLIVLTTFFKKPKVFFFGGSFGYLAVAISAVIVTKWGTVNGPTYSVDCIWFNLLICVIYWLLFLVPWERVNTSLRARL
jgi:hypothetical protein